MVYHSDTDGYPKNMPMVFACGEQFSIAHKLHSPKGDYIITRHNEIRDTFAKLLDDLCYDVEIEPNPQPLQGESFDKKSQRLLKMRQD